MEWSEDGIGLRYGEERSGVWRSMVMEVVVSLEAAAVEIYIGVVVRR